MIGKVGEAAAGRLVTRVQTPVATGAGGHRHGGTIYQVKLQPPVRGRIAAPVSQHMIQHIGQEIHRVTQPIQQGDIANIGKARLGRMAG